MSICSVIHVHIQIAMGLEANLCVATLGNTFSIRPFQPEPVCVPEEECNEKYMLLAFKRGLFVAVNKGLTGVVLRISERRCC